MTATEIAAERMELLLQLDNVRLAMETFYQSKDWVSFHRCSLEIARLAHLLELNANQVPGECS